MHIYMYVFILFLYVFSQGVEYSSLCYTVGSYCLSILYIKVCICYFWIPNPSLTHAPFPLATKICSVCLWVCFCFILYHLHVKYKIQHKWICFQFPIWYIGTSEECHLIFMHSWIFQLSSFLFCSFMPLWSEKNPYNVSLHAFGKASFVA